MPSPNVISFSDALQRTEGGKRYLLLGNGFSMALLPNIFSYKRLFEEADFSGRPHLKRAFDVFNTYDFEFIIRHLIEAPKLIELYSQTSNVLIPPMAKRMIEDGEALKDILVKTISTRHPAKVSDITPLKYFSCRNFLGQFSKVYTLNYDLLLYWAMLHDDPVHKFEIDDGFRNPDHAFGANYRVFDSPHSPQFFFIHGALHIFDAGTEVRKYTWSDTGIPLIQQIRGALNEGLFPLFVAEGTSDEKLTKINHSYYLSKALRSFESICSQRGALFIFGHSLDEKDRHILDKIEEGTIKQIFVSIFKHPENGYSEEIIHRAQLLGSRRSRNKPQVTLFDADSTNVWGPAT